VYKKTHSDRFIRYTKNIFDFSVKMGIEFRIQSYSFIGIDVYLDCSSNPALLLENGCSDIISYYVGPQAVSIGTESVLSGISVCTLNV
jgi:hypothetical protein